MQESHNMTSIEKSCVTYFRNAVITEKQTESSSVNISDLKIYLTSAPKDIRAFINVLHRGDLSQFLSKYPEIFQVDNGSRVFLTSDIINMHGIDNLEKLSVEYFSDKLRTMKAYQSSPVPVMVLKKSLNEAPTGIQSFFSRHYLAKDFKKFFYNHPDIFGVANSGNVYIVQDNQVLDTDDATIPGMFSNASGIIESDVCQDEIDAVNFYRRVLNSPGIQLQACSIDSLFAQLCEAPSNVQRFLQKNYNEVNFLDFFNAHREVFNTSVNGQTSLNEYSRPQTLPLPSDFPSLSREVDDIPPSRAKDQSLQHPAKAPDPEQEAVLFFQSVVESYTQQGEEANVEKLREHLANAPLIVFSYFHNEYPYRQFEKFFLNHASHFTIDSSGVVELAKPSRVNMNETEASPSPPWKSSPPVSSCHSSVESTNEDSAFSMHSRNLSYETQLEKFYWNAFQVAYSYNIRAISPSTLLAISTCLNRRLSTYMANQYGRDMAQFFQCYPNKFRISKNGNICLAVEKESHSETVNKKAALELSADFFVSVLQLLQMHQVTAVSPEILWEFLPLGPPKVNSYFTKYYNKHSCSNFFAKLPRLFAISKNKNVYLSTGTSYMCRTDTSDDDSLESVRASGDPCEVTAIEFFIDRVRSLKLSCYPIPLAILREGLSKAAPRVRSHFEDVYPQEKFLDFFVKYKDFFFVMQPINVVWLTRMDSDDAIDDDVPSNCPLANQSKTFRQVIGVVVAGLLLKSPRAVSTILGHLYNMVAQHSQELGKYPGKSNTERLCSLLSGCFNMFKIVKDNVILSWPVKHASSLILCLEEALAGVCVQIARHDTVSFSKFYTELRTRTERMFQSFIPDTNAMLDFLKRREEFYVLNPDQFIVTACDVQEDQAEEVSSLVEKELRSRTDGVNLQLLLSSIREETFQHSFTCGTIMNVILNRKDKFYIDDSRLFLKKDLDDMEPSQDHVKTASEPELETFIGTGWITNLEINGGTVSAAMGSDNQYAIVNFDKSVFSGADFDKLLVGDEVDFVTTRKDPGSEWMMVKINRSEVPAKRTKLVDLESTEKAGSLPSFSCESSNEEDDGSSTNGEDHIFYSSASDMDPHAEVKNEISEKCLSRDSSRELITVNGHAPVTAAQEKELSGESEAQAAQAYPAVASQPESRSCSGDSWCNQSDMSQMANMLSMINTGEDETPYDKRIISSMSKKLEKMKAHLNNQSEGCAPAGCIMKAVVDGKHLEEEKLDSVSDQHNIDVEDHPCSASEDVKSTHSEDSGQKSDFCRVLEQPVEEWNGAGIWDVEPFVEAMEAQHINALKDESPWAAKITEGTQLLEEDWEAEITNVTEPTAVLLEHEHTEVEECTAVVSKEEDVPSHKPDHEASISDSSETLKSRFSRECSPVSRPSLSEELELQNGQCSTNKPVGDSEMTKPSCHDNSSNISGAPPGNGTAPRIVLEANEPVLSKESSTSDESAPCNLNDGCTELAGNEYLPAQHRSTAANVVRNQQAGNGHAKGVPIMANVVQIDSSTLVLKLNVETVGDELFWQRLCVGDQIAIQTFQNCESREPVAALKPQPETKSVGTEGTIDSKDASAQTVSTGAILAANLLVE